MTADITLIPLPLRDLLYPQRNDTSVLKVPSHNCWENTPTRAQFLGIFLQHHCVGENKNCKQSFTFSAPFSKKKRSRDDIQNNHLTIWLPRGVNPKTVFQGCRSLKTPREETAGRPQRKDFLQGWEFFKLLLFVSLIFLLLLAQLVTAVLIRCYCLQSSIDNIDILTPKPTKYFWNWAKKGLRHLNV